MQIILKCWWLFLFIVSNVSAHFGVIFSEKVDYNTSLKVSQSQIGRNAIINTLRENKEVHNIDSQFS